LKIPKALGMRIQDIAINKGPHGYRSVSEFAIEAIRIKLQYLEEQAAWRNKTEVFKNRDLGKQ
jgi:hypothetical protein